MKLRPGKSHSVTRTERRPEPGRWHQFKLVITTLVPPYLLWPVPGAPAPGSALLRGGCSGQPRGLHLQSSCPWQHFWAFLWGRFRVCREAEVRLLAFAACFSAR